jgi:hypothetical protein
MLIRSLSGREALGYVSARTLGLLWAILMLLIVTGIPLAYLLIGRKRGWVSDMELSRREERPRFILVSLSSDVLALLVLCLFRGPHLLTVIVLTYFCLAIVIFSISSFWKISMHMAGVGGFSTALVFVFGAPALWAFLSLLLVAWARLHRRKHTVPPTDCRGAGRGAGHRTGVWLAGNAHLGGKTRIKKAQASLLVPRTYFRPGFYKSRLNGTVS